MPLRLIEINLPSDQAKPLGQAIEEVASAGAWDQALADGQIRVRLLQEVHETGATVDRLQQEFGKIDGFRLLITSVEAALPRPEESPEPAPPEDVAPAPAIPKRGPDGLSREELYADMRDIVRLSTVFIATVALSTLVAAVGMLRDNVAVIIGAMVIAPLLGPNVALAFGTTLADGPMIRRALTSNLVGVVIALVMASVIGATFQIDPTVGELANRATVHVSDIVLGLAAGAAAVLAVTSGIPSALVGVMVAVALLPPTVAVGLMLGSGHLDLAMGAALLLMVNVICVNLAGVITFLLRGVRPLTWWEANRAKRAWRLALMIWIGLLLVLAILISVVTF